MASVGIYLNFSNQAEEAFHFYKSVFGGEFSAFTRFSDMPSQEGAPPMPEEVAKGILHIALPILGGFQLMGSDAPESMGFNVHFGNNNYICLTPDSKEETKRLFEGLSAGGKVEQELQDTFWGSYFGTCFDKFGVQWMFDIAN
jgi:PhnB protein